MVVNAARQIRNRRRRDARTQKKAKGFEKMRSLAGLIVSKPVRLRVEFNRLSRVRVKRVPRIYVIPSI